MNLSKKVALILGPSLAIGVLLIGYWAKTHRPDAGAPLELHANMQPAEEAALPPSSAIMVEPVPDTTMASREQPSAIMVVPAGPSVKPPVPDPKAGSSALVASAPVHPATPPASAPRAIAPPKFDVVRVEPTGDAVIAGHTEPDSHVAVVANGKVIAEGKSDVAGQFVLLPKPLAPGDYALALQMVPPSGPAVVSDQNVAVSVPVKGKGDVMVALAETGKPTVLLADPTAKPQAPKPEAAPSVKPEVSIKTVEIVEHGGFYATGYAAPNAHLRLYLNGSMLVDVTAGADSQWTVKIVKGLVPGHYSVRVDQLDRRGGVLARAEVPFDYSAPKQPEVAAAAPLRQPVPPAVIAPVAEAPKQNASIAPPASPLANIATANPVPPVTPVPDQTTDTKPSANPEKAAESATAVVGEIQTATVQRGSSLWRISRGMLGRGTRYTEIYAANSSQIRDPKLIYPGQVFVIPGDVN
jgi:nucleoid-associated protein YgaU